METFATIPVTPATQARFNALLDRLGSFGADELVNEALEALADKEGFPWGPRA